MNNLKKYIIWFLVWLLWVWTMTYAAGTNGSIGELFEKLHTWNWVLLWENIKDATVTDDKLDTALKNKITQISTNKTDITEINSSLDLWTKWIIEKKWDNLEFKFNWTTKIIFSSDWSITANKQVLSINWTCWTSNNSCTSWTLSDIADSATQYLWNCNWLYWWTTAGCSLNKPVDWICWTTTDTCIAWTFWDSSFYGYWVCYWENWWDDVSCGSSTSLTDILFCVDWVWFKCVKWVCWSEANTCDVWKVKLLRPIPEAYIEYWECGWSWIDTPTKCSIDNPNYLWTLNVTSETAWK